MSWKLEIDINKLEDYNARLKTMIDELNSEIEELSAVIATTCSYWKGDAAEAYIHLMENRLSKAREVYVSLSGVRFAVKAQIDNLRAADNWFEKAAYEIFH